MEASSKISINEDKDKDKDTDSDIIPKKKGFTKKLKRITN